jgi:hypothetical protein
VAAAIELFTCNSKHTQEAVFFGVVMEWLLGDEDV